MEQEPLLEDESASSHVLEQDRSNDRPVKSRSLRSFFFCIFAFAFCIEFNVNILELSMIRLIKLMICRRYIDADLTDIDEEACKILIMQTKIAIVIGYKITLNALSCEWSFNNKMRKSSNHLRKFFDDFILRTSFRLLRSTIRNYASNKWSALDSHLDRVHW